MSTIESSRLSVFNSDRVSFGRHETFPLRYGWLTKGFQQISSNPQALRTEDITVKLGVGRNMVYSISYWLRATRIVEATNDGLIPTQLGHKIFGPKGFDPHLEDEATIWLLHWLLGSHPEQATAWYWFFNRFHKTEFTSQEAITAITQFVQTFVTAKVSLSKAKQDSSIVLRMYAQTKAAPRTAIEDTLDSPLSTLRLISYTPGSRRYISKPSMRPTLPVDIVAFVITDISRFKGVNSIPIEELMGNRFGFPAPGAIFRLNEAGLLSALEQLVQKYPKEFALRESAGLHQVFIIGHKQPMDYLSLHYSRGISKAA